MFPPQKPKIFNTIRKTAKVLTYTLAYTLGLATLGFAIKYSLDLCSYVYSALATTITNEVLLVALSITLCMILCCSIVTLIVISVQYVSYWVYKVKYNKKIKK